MDVMPECFYRASIVFCDTGENIKTLDSRLKIAGMTEKRNARGILIFSF